MVRRVPAIADALDSGIRHQLELLKGNLTGRINELKRVAEDDKQPERRERLRQMDEWAFRALINVQFDMTTPRGFAVSMCSDHTIAWREDADVFPSEQLVAQVALAVKSLPLAVTPELDGWINWGEKYRQELEEYNAILDGLMHHYDTTVFERAARAYANVFTQGAAAPKDCGVDRRRKRP